MDNLSFGDMRLLAMQKVLNTLLNKGENILITTHKIDINRISLHYSEEELVVIKDSRNNIEIILSLDSIINNSDAIGVSQGFDLKPNESEYSIMESYINCIMNIKNLQYTLNSQESKNLSYMHLKINIDRIIIN